MNWKRWLLSVAVLAMGWGAASAQESPQALGLVADDGRVTVVVDASGSLDLGKFWIGVSVGDVPESLRAHLKLEEGVGVLALDVVDKGPAQMAGLEKHDILLKAGEQSLRSAKDLISAVNQAEMKELKFEVLHKGEKKTVAVKPQERPADQAKVAIVDENVIRTYTQFLSREGNPTLNGDGVIFVRPGKAIPVPQAGKLAGQPGIQWSNLGPQVYSPPPLPNGVSVSITRTNNEPAKITVKRGEESWDVTEKELDKLPADLRPHIEGMLGRQPGHSFSIPAWRPITVPGQSLKGQPVPMTARRPQNAQDEPVKKSDLLELEEKIKELSKKLDALGKKE